MKKTLLTVLTCGILYPTLSHAVVINENIFEQNGGNLSDIADSIRYANNELREISYQQKFLTVGSIYGCTGTWLGNDSSGYTYILTAAHCLPYTAEVTPIDRKFTSWDGRIIAQGTGTAYVPPERINRPSGFGGASTDIGIMKIPTNDVLTDKTGKPVAPPIINDEFNELNNKAMFVGYGLWGVGLNNSGSYLPATGDRRLYGETIISGIMEMEHGIRADYTPTGETLRWSRVASGDSGSAWWQDTNGFRVIIATTNGGSSLRSTGARVSKYASWIEGIYPDVRLLSKMQGCIVSVNTGEQYCLPIGERSGYTLPDWILGEEIYVKAAPGVEVFLSDWDNLSYNRVAGFTGTVSSEDLKHQLAQNGEYLDFNYPRSMRVAAAE